MVRNVGSENDGESDGKYENAIFYLLFKNCVFIRLSLCSQLHAAKNCACANVSNSLALARITKITKSNLKELILETRML